MKNLVVIGLVLVLAVTMLAPTELNASETDKIAGGCAGCHKVMLPNQSDFKCDSTDVGDCTIPYKDCANDDSENGDICSDDPGPVSPCLSDTTNCQNPQLNQSCKPYPTAS